jgi:hypothetical protein
MNVQKIKGYLIAITLSCLITGSVSYLLYKTASATRDSQYRATESAIINDNLELRRELQETELRLREYKGFINEAGGILASQQSSTEKLRKLIESLPD